MSHKEKILDFHKIIRREQLQKYFQSKRIQMMGVEAIEQDQTTINRWQNIKEVDKKTLKSMARATLTQRGIEIIKKLHIEKLLRVYLKDVYINTEQQCNASLILCNLLLIPDQRPPQKQMVFDLYSIFRGQNLITISHCLEIFFNTMNDHPLWKQKAIIQYELSNQLNFLFQKQKINKDLLLSLMRTIFKMLYKSKMHESFKLLRNKLLSLLTNPLNIDVDIIRHAIHCFYLIFAMSPQETAPVVIQIKLLPQLIKMAPLINQHKFTHITLEMIIMTLSRIGSTQFIEHYFTFLKKLLRQDQNHYSITTAHDKNIELLVYRIIYQALESGIISANNLIKDQICQQLLNKFAISEDLDILNELVYIFSLVLLNINQQSQYVNQIQNLLLRAQKICPHEIEMIGYIRQTLLSWNQSSL